jgi:lipoprotein-anchoring transpeptidase ErfK/SrfK
VKCTVSTSALVVAGILAGGAVPVAAYEARATRELRPIIAPERSAARLHVANITARRQVKPDGRKARDRKTKANTELVIPQGPLHVVVSIDKQRVTLFADGKPVTSSAVSTGTPGHPTPMGVFSVIQKRRHHVSNLYGAEMPFMQRLTWSGTAMHQGPLPGRPASHGCIRLSGEFAQLLWKATRIGARVIVTRGEANPVEFDMPWRFSLTPMVAASPRGMMAAAGPVPIDSATEPAPKPDTLLVKTTAATEMASTVAEVSRAVVTRPATNAAAPAQASKAAFDGRGRVELIPVTDPAPAAPAEAPVQPRLELRTQLPATDERPTPIVEPETVPLPTPAPPQAKRSTDPVSIFISRKSGKLYVRQKWRPLFEAPVTIANSDQPLGTHVYTVMATKDDAVRWTAISIPSNPKRAAEHGKTVPGKQSNRGKKLNREKPAVQIAFAAPEPGARAALDRITIPPEAVERFASLLIPGSSIIVSDNGLSNETGEYTDFIVLTP